MLKKLLSRIDAKGMIPHVGKIIGFKHNSIIFKTNVHQREYGMQIKEQELKKLLDMYGVSDKEYLKDKHVITLWKEYPDQKWINGIIPIV